METQVYDRIFTGKRYEGRYGAKCRQIPGTPAGWVIEVEFEDGFRTMSPRAQARTARENKAVNYLLRRTT